MANIKSAQKKIKVTARNHARRITVISAVKKAFKSAEKAVSQSGANAAELVKVAIKVIDKAVSNKIIHKKTGARHKSRLMHKFNALKK